MTVTRIVSAWPDGGYDTPGGVYVDPDGSYKDHLVFACPGCGNVGSIRATRPKNAGGSHSWEITTGSLAEPETLTLAPSIHCVGCCGWHGFLVNGRFQMKPD